MSETYWGDLYKIKINNSDDSFQKHEVVKLLIVMKLLNKYKKVKNWIRIYTEFELENRKCDIYFENIKDKSVIIYEIQKNITTLWMQNIEKDYKDYEVKLMDSTDLVIVSLKECPDNLTEINKWLEDYIV